MGFMTDVKVGGATVFPLLGVMHQPQKGDAILWWVTTGEGDKVGSKFMNTSDNNYESSNIVIYFIVDLHFI